jgi:hypothetical protein
MLKISASLRDCCPVNAKYLERVTMSAKLYGYNGKFLRVNLTAGNSATENVDSSLLRQYLGGAALGIRYLYNELPPATEWSDPSNRPGYQCSYGLGHGF